MAEALAGLSSASPPPKVTRSPAPVFVAALAALSETGGGGGGAASADGGGVATGASATVGGGAVGSVAGGGVTAAVAEVAGAAVAAGEVVATDGVAAEASVVGSGEGFVGVVATRRWAGFDAGCWTARCFPAGLAPGSASSACRSTVTCASAGTAMPNRAVSTTQYGRMRVRIPGDSRDRTVTGTLILFTC